MSRNDLTRESAAFEEARLPQFLLPLLLEPPVADKQAVYHASPILVSAGLFRRSYDLRRDDVAVGLGQGRPLLLEGDDLLNQVFQTQSDLCNLLRWQRGSDLIAAIRGEHCDGISVVTGYIVLIAVTDKQADTMTYIVDSPRTTGEPLSPADYRNWTTIHPSWSQDTD